MSRWKNVSTGPERRPSGSASSTIRFRISSVGTSPLHSGVIPAGADLARIVGTALVGEPCPHVHPCALDAVRRGHGQSVGGAQEREPEAPAGSRVPAVRCLARQVHPAGGPEAEDPKL